MTDETTAGPNTQIGEIVVAGTTYPLRDGLMATVGTLDGATGYAVQKAWYDAKGLKEPERVRARREALGNPKAQASGRDNKSEQPRPASQGPTITKAKLIRKGIAEGQTGAEIMATVKAFGHRCKASDVEYYRREQGAK
jgi:hypothetical protein